MPPKPIGETAMTNAERQRKWREKQRARQGDRNANRNGSPDESDKDAEIDRLQKEVAKLKDALLQLKDGKPTWNQKEQLRKRDEKIARYGFTINALRNALAQQHRAQEDAAGLRLTKADLNQLRKFFHPDTANRPLTADERHEAMVTLNMVAAKAKKAN